MLWCQRPACFGILSGREDGYGDGEQGWTGQRPPQNGNDRLDSWKEIAAHFGRGITTLQRWEREESLPVHRLQHDKQGSVFAYREELDAWWSSRLAEDEKSLDFLTIRIRRRTLAMSAALALCVRAQPRSSYRCVLHRRTCAVTRRTLGTTGSLHSRSSAADCFCLGYRNADGPSGKCVIVSDPDAAPMITELFGRFATGRYSLKVLVKEVNGEGLKLRGRKLYSSVVHQILRKRLYTGDFDWDGSTYTGSHEPLVTRECWQRVQELLDARAEDKTRKVKHDFAYTGLVHCGHCGCLFVGELKKRKYVYYHCTGNRGKCEEPYTRQEILAREFAEVLQELVIPQAILEWLGNDVLTSDQTEQAARAQAIKKLQTRYDQIQASIETMYLDKLDGRITQEFFDKQSAAWRSEQDGLRRKIQDVQKATPAPIDQAVDMLRLTSRASELFLQQPAAEQRRLLQVVVEKAAWQDGALRTTLFEPFAKSCAIRTRKVIEKKRETAGQDATWKFGSPVWTRFELLHLS